MKHFVIGLKRWKEKPGPNDYIIKTLLVEKLKKTVFLFLCLKSKKVAELSEI